MRTALIAAVAAVAATYGLTSLAAATYSPAPAPSPSPSSAPDPEPTGVNAGLGLGMPNATEVPPPDPTHHWRADPNSSSGPPDGRIPIDAGPVTGKKPWTVIDLRWMDREHRYYIDHIDWDEPRPPTGPTDYARIADAIEAGNPPDRWYDIDYWFPEHRWPNGPPGGIARNWDADGPRQ